METLVRTGLSPDAVVVQASSRAWYGAREYGCNDLDGVPVVVRTIRRLREAFADAPLRVAAPGFDAPTYAGPDPGDLHALLADAGEGDVPLVCGHDASPLARMVHATRDLPVDALVLRVNALNCFVDPRTIRDAVRAARQLDVDGYSTRDDYPALLSFDLYRVGALRRLLAELPADDPCQVHPKYALRRRDGYVARQHPPGLHYTREEMAAFREATRRIYTSESPEAEPSKTVSAGNKLDFRYELCLPRMQPGSEVLDVACGFGHGAAVLARGGMRVLGGDLDETIVARANELYGEMDDVRFERMDVLATGLPDGAIDYVASMGTIEHVDVDGYLREMKRVLRPGGRLFVVTPQNCHGDLPLCCWHHVEFTAEELRRLLGQHFLVEEFFGIKQGRVAYEDELRGSSSFAVCRRR